MRALSHFQAEASEYRSSVYSFQETSRRITFAGNPPINALGSSNLLVKSALAATMHPSGILDPMNTPTSTAISTWFPHERRQERWSAPHPARIPYARPCREGRRSTRAGNRRPRQSPRCTNSGNFCYYKISVEDQMPALDAHHGTLAKVRDPVELDNAVVGDNHCRTVARNSQAATEADSHAKPSRVGNPHRPPLAGP